MSAVAAILLSLAPMGAPPASAYLIDTTVPQAGGCPAFNRWNISPGSPLNRRWSTAVPTAPATLVTIAGAGTPAQLAEIEQAIADSFGAWSGVTGTTLTQTGLARSTSFYYRVQAVNAVGSSTARNATPFPVLTP